MTQNFKSEPKKRAKKHNPKWTQGLNIAVPKRSKKPVHASIEAAIKAANPKLATYIPLSHGRKVIKQCDVARSEGAA